MASARRWARKLERSCCACAKYFPLAFVYSLTTWAVFVLVSLSSSSTKVAWLGVLPPLPPRPIPVLLLTDSSPTGKPSAIVGTGLYLLLNWCYTTAVFTPPGSTTNDNGYSTLPTHAAPTATSFTAKSNGELRFCKKCQARKPDRAHHCSTCRRCVLKMDHHCPWLATCVGLHNHKAFLLFLIYTTLFCLFCFAASGAWVWQEIFVSNSTYVEDLMPVNYIMLCVIAGIIGLAIGAFTGWHIYLAARGQTTIECLEKTRYLSPLRRTMHQTYINQHTPGQGVALPSYGQQLLDIHQNALPGITRPEEGEELRREPSPYRPHHHSLDTATGRASPSNGSTTTRGPDLQAGSRRFTPDEMERHRARRRYEEYLDEQDSTRLPNAFDLGVKRNLLHLFGANPWLWALPVCNTTGDGWSWEPNPRWVEARDRIAKERWEQAERERVAGWGGEGYADEEEVGVVQGGAGRHYLQPQQPLYRPRPQPSPSLLSQHQQQQQRAYHTAAPASAAGRKTPSKADRILGRDPNLYADGAVGGLPGHSEAVSLRRLSPTGRTVEEELDDIDRHGDEEEDEEDEEEDEDGLLHQHHNREVGAGDNHHQQQQQRAEAERRALNVVTNGRWGAAPSASTLLRGPGSGLSSPRGFPEGSTGGGKGSNNNDDDDDGVD